jgi:hypothetical protein
MKNQGVIKNNKDELNSTHTLSAGLSHFIIPFELIFVFALKNLPFPENNPIPFSSCVAPGEVLLLGNFTLET